MMLVLHVGVVDYFFKVSWVFLAAIAHLATIRQPQAVVRHSPTPRGYVRRQA